MPDLNNRLGGPHLIVTAKTAHKVQFLDAATLTINTTIDMPGSTHELALSANGRTAYGSVYGDGTFAKRVDPDRRVVVIDLPSKTLTRVIDLGAVYAPHGIMMDERGRLWVTAELGNSLLVIDPSTDRIERIDVGATAHWLVLSEPLGQAFVSVKMDHLVAVDIARCAMISRIALPSPVEGIAIAPDGLTVYACANDAAEIYVIDAASHALRAVVPIEGSTARGRQMRRAQVSPDGRHLVVSSNQDAHAAIFLVDGLKQIASFPTPRGPMGFGFAPDGAHAYLCGHDDAEMIEFRLADGAITRRVATASGCEFVVGYGQFA